PLLCTGLLHPLRSPRPPWSPLFPYTTLFRSCARTSVVWKCSRPRRTGSTPYIARSRHAVCQPRNPKPPVSARVTSGSRVFLRGRSEEHTSELQSRFDLVCRLLLEQKKQRCAR